MHLEVRVDPSIFEKHPSFRRGIVFAQGLDNRGNSPELECLLQQAVTEAGTRPIDLKGDPRVVAWTEAYRGFHANPGKFPPAHCALLRRVQRPGAQIPFINKVVAIMNYASITAKMPVGGDDCQVSGRCLVLRHADGTESFVPLGQPDVMEHPEPGEIIYVAEESGDVMCRRWNWRNGHPTRIEAHTRTMVMNIDGLGQDSAVRATRTRDRVAQLLETFCAAKTEVGMLSPSLPALSFLLS